MPLRVVTTGFEELSNDILELGKDMRRRLAARYRSLARELSLEVRSQFEAVGLHEDSGTLLENMKERAWANSTSAGLKVWVDRDPVFYAGWLEHGLAPRPWHERARSRRVGIINSRLGRARDVAGAKPWGIQARPFFAPAAETITGRIMPETEAVLAEACEAFNTSR